jgi:hypothetical protein
MWVPLPLGKVFINETGLEGTTDLTGSEDFKIKGIEVFWVHGFQPHLQSLGTFESLIISDILEVFAEFRGKTSCALLWRDSGDGFGASDFHRQCDDHPNTLIVVLDTKANIFGGFTPSGVGITRNR